MGFLGIFPWHQCSICWTPLPPAEPPIWICLRCEVDAVVPLLPFLGQYADLPLVALPDIMSFLVIDRRHRQRLYFLREVLLAVDSRFRLFTYYCNGMAGSISSSEDILDRILRFL